MLAYINILLHNFVKFHAKIARIGEISTKVTWGYFFCVHRVVVAPVHEDGKNGRPMHWGYSTMGKCAQLLLRRTTIVGGLTLTVVCFLPSKF